MEYLLHNRPTRAPCSDLYSVGGRLHSREKQHFVCVFSKSPLSLLAAHRHHADSFCQACNELCACVRVCVWVWVWRGEGGTSCISACDEVGTKSNPKTMVPADVHCPVGDWLEAEIDARKQIFVPFHSLSAEWSRASVDMFDFLRTTPPHRSRTTRPKA